MTTDADYIIRLCVYCERSSQIQRVSILADRPACPNCGRRHWAQDRLTLAHWKLAAAHDLMCRHECHAEGIGCEACLNELERLANLLVADWVDRRTG